MRPDFIGPELNGFFQCIFSEASEMSKLCCSFTHWLPRALPSPSYCLVGVFLCSTLGCPKPCTLKVWGGAQVTQEVIWSTVPGLFLRAQTSPSPCSVLCANVKLTPDSSSKWEQGAFSQEDTVHTACSTVLGKDPACSVCL